MANISVIIPVADSETEHPALLSSLPNDLEVIVSSEGTRAKSLNKGAMRAAGEYLWFLHADSQLTTHTIAALYNAIYRYPDSLLYFDLAFTQDTTPLIRLNQWGAWFRSHVLGIPFGDQGFCIRAELFKNIGGFPEDVSYGEDHVFVWKARQFGIPLASTGAALVTSARKYKQHGWLYTTILHQYLWIKQAIPEWKKLKQTKTT